MIPLRPTLVPGTAEPSEDDTLRALAWRVLDNGAAEDFLDFAVLADRVGWRHAASVLCQIDSYFMISSHEPDPVSTQLALTLASPEPTDPALLSELPSDKGLDPRWHDWDEVVTVCQAVALRMGQDT